jgi:Cytochrome c554 and c-prime
MSAMNVISRIGCAAALAMAGSLFAGPASAALSDDDNACLGCHAQEGLTKSFGKGETLPLRVDGAEFERSVHAPLGCAACHADVDLKTHPGAVKSFDSLRAYSLAKAAVCQQCHEDAFKQHEASVHAKRTREGNPLAPACSGCHGAHGVTPKTAYQTCVSCHSAALEAHGKWLPNAARHHEVVSCAACHAPVALRMVDLRLYDPAAKAWVAEKAGDPWFEKLAKSVDADGNGLDARELLELVNKLKAAGGGAERTFRGRIELRDGVEAHRVADKGAAIRACDSCHQAGAEPFRYVAVSVTGPDGRPLRHAARPQVLNSPQAFVALPAFYAVGGTRSALLDTLFVLALLGGASFPIGHLAVRWLARRLRS